jgi:hypothetical protein
MLCQPGGRVAQPLRRLILSFKCDAARCRALRSKFRF